MRPLPNAHRHFRWTSQLIFWFLAAMTAGLLLVPAVWENRVETWYVMTVWFLAAGWV